MNDYKRVKYYAGCGWSPLQNVYRLDELLSNTENKHHYSINEMRNHNYLNETETMP